MTSTLVGEVVGSARAAADLHLIAMACQEAVGGDGQRLFRAVSREVARPHNAALRAKQVHQRSIRGAGQWAMGRSALEGAQIQEGLDWGGAAARANNLHRAAIQRVR